MKTRIFFALGIALILFSCEKATIESAAPTNIFSLSINPNYGDFYEKWVIINDINGEVLDFKQVKSGEDVQFKTSLPIPQNKISVTFFSFDSVGNYTAQYFNTFQGLSVGTNWKLQKNENLAPKDKGMKIGNLKLEIANSNDILMEVLGNGENTNITVTNNNSSRILDWEIFKNTNSAFYSVLMNGKLKYNFFEKINSSQLIKINLEGLQNFDKLLNFKLPKVNDPYVSVKAFDDNGSDYYYIFRNFFQTPPFAPSKTYENLQIGFLNKFKKYETNMTFAVGNYYFNYYKKGGVPDIFDLPKNISINVMNKAMPDFSFNTDLEYDWQKITFSKFDAQSKKSIHWNIMSPKGEYKSVKLPDVFMSKFSKIKIEDFSKSIIYLTKSSQSYSDMLKDLFQSTQAKESEIENFQYTF